MREAHITRRGTSFYLLIFIEKSSTVKLNTAYLFHMTDSIIAVFPIEGETASYTEEQTAPYFLPVSPSRLYGENREWLQILLFSPHHLPLYWASVTFSIHSTTLPGSFSSQIEICVIALFGAAPCQCLTPTGHMTTSPALISCIGLPHS